MIRLMLMTVAAGVAGVVALGAVSMGSAAPPERETVDLDCGADGTFVATLVGQGEWAPAFLDDGRLFKPTGFTDQSGTFTDNEGNVFEFTEPDVVKRSPPHRELLECSFTVEFVDEEGTGVFTGNVIGFIVR